MLTRKMMLDRRRCTRWWCGCCRSKGRISMRRIMMDGRHCPSRPRKGTRQWCGCCWSTGRTPTRRIIMEGQRCTGQAGNATMMRLLLEHGTDIDAKDNYGRTAPYWAGWERDKAMMQLLLEHGAKLTRRIIVEGRRCPSRPWKSTRR